MNKFIQMAILAAVGVILVFSLCLPLVDSSTAETRTVHNTGAYFTTPDENEHTILIQHGQITYDGKPCAWPDLTLYGSANIAVGTDWMLRVDSGSNPATDTLRYVFAGPPYQWNPIGTVNPATDDVLTIVLNGDSLTATIGNSTFSRVGTEFIICDKGDYVLSQNPYLLSDTQITAAIRNNYNTANTDTFEIVRGTVGDVENMTVDICRNVNSSLPASDQFGDIVNSVFTVETKQIDGDLLKLDKITQVATMWFTPPEGAGYTNVATFTITYVIVPETITYDNPDYVGGTMASMLNLVPLMLVVSLVLAIIGYAVKSRLS